MENLDKQKKAYSGRYNAFVNLSNITTKDLYEELKTRPDSEVQEIIIDLLRKALFTK